MPAWLYDALPWAVPLIFTTLGFIVVRAERFQKGINDKIEKILIQVTRTNGTVIEHSNWIEGHEKWAAELKTGLAGSIAGLQERELARLNSEVVEARKARSKR